MPAYIHSDRGSSFMSKELRDFLVSKGISCSRTTSYNPQGNGQAERYNGTIWKAITMALKSRGLPTKYWQMVLPDALHSVRSLLSTSTNTTPHERMLNFARRSSSGHSVPSWLCESGKVLLKRHVRHSKTEPLVDEVELLQANPSYAHVRFADGRETTVSTRHLAPLGTVDGELPAVHSSAPGGNTDPVCPESSFDILPEVGNQEQNGNQMDSVIVTRSGRVSREPVRLDL